jgi:hypothetical protein
MADASILSLLEMLPQLLNILQIIVYVILAWFFGSIALKGLKKHLIIPFRIVLSFCVGFLCLICGVVIAGYVPFMQDPFFKLFQIDITIGSLIASVIFAFALYLITRKFEKTDPKTLIKKLRKRVGLLEGLLLKYRVPTIKEEEARNIAGKAVPGYGIKEAKISRTEWEILMQKGGSKATVVIGAYDGKVKTIDYEMPKTEYIISHPFRVLGIGIIILVLGFSMVNFRGFPSMTEGISSMFGFPLGGDENLPEGCVGAGRLVLKYNPSLTPLEDESIKAMIESGAGIEIHWMYMIDYEGENYILAIDSNFENVCSATEEKFCQCIQIPLL